MDWMLNGSVGNCMAIFTLQLSPAVCTPICCNFALKFTFGAEKGAALIRREAYAQFAELPSLSTFKDPILTCWTNFLQDFWDVFSSANRSSCLCTPWYQKRMHVQTVRLFTHKPCSYSFIDFYGCSADHEGLAFPIAQFWDWLWFVEMRWQMEASIVSQAVKRQKRWEPSPPDVTVFNQ